MDENEKKNGNRLCIKDEKWMKNRKRMEKLILKEEKTEN